MDGARAKKRAKKISVQPELKEEDRISLLPEELLHRILCSPSLSQKEATRTCLLSRAWRYLGCTRPKIKWTDFANSSSTLDKILESYHRRNLGLDEFSLRLSVYWEGKTASFLHKWIPIIVHNMRVKTLCLNMGWEVFELPSLIIESDHCSLEGGVFISSLKVRVSLHRLQTLQLERVNIPEDILNSILSNCPFLEDVRLSNCKGFTRIKLYINNNKPTKLARFSFCDSHFPQDHDRVSIEIGDDSQTHTSIDNTECKPLESAQNRRRLSIEIAHLLSYSFSCSFTILELYDVYITERIILDNILSYCPSIKNVSLKYCKGFETIEMLNNTPTNLQHFCFHGKDDHLVSIEIGNNIKTLRSIDISYCLFSVSHNKRLKCARLTRLSLRSVEMLSESFSCNLHSLEELKLDECKGIKEFKLSSRSMKRLSIHNISKPFKATIDAPGMVNFQYQGILPQSISFATTSHHWKSNIILGSSSVKGHDHCFNELYDLLKALSQSELTLELSIIDIRLGTQLHASVLEEASKHELPVAVEHLRIKRLARKARSSAAAFLNMLFRMFRPSFVYLFNTNKKHREMAELLFKKREPAQCYLWQHVLVEVDLQVKYHRKQRFWQAVKHMNFTDLSKKGTDGGKLKYRIHLTWRG